MLSKQTTSDVESIGENYDLYSWEEYDATYDGYLKCLTHLHSDHVYNYNWGCFFTEDFQSKIVDDVYNNSLCSISWIYHGCYEFDTYKVENKSSLNEEAWDHRLLKESLEYLGKFVFQCYFCSCYKC